MKINELRKLTGIHIETIRYYEKIGLLPKPKRLANGYRDYDENSLYALQFVKTCRALGFTIKEIRHFNELKSSPEKHGEIDNILLTHLSSIDDKIAQLTEVKIFLRNLLNEEMHEPEDCKVIKGLEQI